MRASSSSWEIAKARISRSLRLLNDRITVSFFSARQSARPLSYIFPPLNYSFVLLMTGLTLQAASDIITGLTGQSGFGIFTLVNFESNYGQTAWEFGG